MSDGRVKEVIVDSRINKVLAMRTDSVAMLEALDAISEFYVSNTADSRRALRQDLEQQNISLAKKFLIEFDDIRNSIESVEEMSNKLELVSVQLASRVSDADENMKLFMEKASELESRRNMLTAQGKEINSFLLRFQLNDDEIEILHNTPIDDPKSAKQFFDALQRLRTAYLDCKTMVEKHSYSAGFELLEVLGNHQDAAYQRLFGWVKQQCDQLAECAANEDIDILLQTAIRYLRKLPVYFAQCQDLVVNSRRAQLVQRFVVALTQGGGQGQGHKAIDLHAHDAVRYVGDMLAWMHQSVASEEEFLESVFGNPADLQQRREARKKNFKEINLTPNTHSPMVDNALPSVNENTEDGEDVTSGDGSQLTGLTISELLARSLQGLGRPLRVRIMQTMESRAGLGVLYTLTDLLKFYEITFSQILPMENAVHSAVKGCQGEARRLFLVQLNKQAETLTSAPSSYPLDLTACMITKDCCKQIVEILEVHAAALSPMSSDPNDDCNIDSVLGNIIQPLLQSCRLSGQPLSNGDMAIFMLNNVSAVQVELSEASKRHDLNRTKTATKAWLDLLQNEAETWVTVLVTEEVGRVLRRSDLDKLLDLMEVLPEGIVAVEQPGLSQDRAGTALRAFYASLFSAVTPQYERLQDPECREVTRRKTADAVAEAHLKVHSVVSNPSNGYDTSILAHSVEEVRVLLGCTSSTTFE